MKKIFFLAVLMCMGIASFAQITAASLTASGLTCSMCSRSIYKSLVKLPSVAKVTEDIEHSTFLIEFKPGAAVTPDQVRKAVTDAGFAVATLKMTADFRNAAVANDAHIELQGNTYHFIDVKQQQLNGPHTFTVIDKNFVTTADFRKYRKHTNMKCYDTGMSESCCHSGAKKGSRIYHVTL